MEIELNDEQFETLVKMIYAGNWILNASRTDRIDEFDDLANLIYTLADENDSDYVSLYEENDRYYPSGELEDRMREFVNEYENEAFWDMLVSRLAMRDLRDDFDRETIENMETEEWMEKRHDYEQPYIDEFEKNGIERLTIDRED